MTSVSNLLLDPQFESLVLTGSAAVVAVIAALRHRHARRQPLVPPGEADAPDPGPGGDARREPAQVPEPSSDDSP